MVIVRDYSSIGFGIESTYQTAPTTLSKWMGWQKGDIAIPDPKWDTRDYYPSGASVTPQTNRQLIGTMEWDWTVVNGHAIPLYLGMGNNVDGGSSPAYTHTLTHGQQIPTITAHKVLGYDTGTQTHAVNYSGSYVSKMNVNIEEAGEMQTKLSFATTLPTPNTASGAFVTAQLCTDNPQGVYPYTTDMITLASNSTGLTGNDVAGAVTNLLFGSYSWDLDNGLKKIVTGRSTNGQFAYKYARGTAKNTISLKAWPEDDTWWHQTVIARQKFNLVLTLQRGTNDSIVITHNNCRVEDPGQSMPEEGDIASTLSIRALSTSIVVTDGQANLTTANYF